jgi:hypothetical protein
MDRIAAASMAQPGMTAMFEGEPAITKAAEILIPEPGDEFGPGGVVTGFPHTPEGAVAQLAVIETEVLTTMCVDITKEIHEGWVQKGGPSFEAWEMTQAVRGFLAGLNQGRCKDSAVQISVDPVAGIIKGTVGQDWVLACVLLDFTAAKSDSKRFGYGHCARMAWVDDRWQVAAGKPPADAPSALPDTQAAVDAGWLSWTNVALGG